MKGNQQTGLELSSTSIGTYERSRPEEQAVPDGYLLDDRRNRFRFWGDYRFDLDRAGVLVLGGIGRYETGGNWNRAASVEFTDDPEYNNEVGQFYTHYFDGRVNNNFDDWWSLDLSARWQVQIYKKLDVWLKATVVNVFDNDALIAYDTFGFAVDDGSGNLSWEAGPNFGQPRNQDDYQVPRSYVFTLGLAF